MKKKTKIVPADDARTKTAISKTIAKLIAINEPTAAGQKEMLASVKQHIDAENKRQLAHIEASRIALS
jgi:hypothetical protein